MKSDKKAYILYVIFLLVVAAVVLEVGARWRHTRSYLAANIRRDPVYHHLIPPNTQGTMSSEGDFDDIFIVNNKGMRGPGDYQYAKKEGVYRIAVMGDSFTFGVGVKAEETFSSFLQQMLAGSSAVQAEVFNFGVSSFSPVLEFIYLKWEIVRYQPDLLILALDLCDVQDDYLYEPHLVYDRSGEIVACDPFRYHGGADVWAMLKDRSVFLTILDEKLLQSVRKIKMMGPVEYLRNKINGVRNKTEILLNPNKDNIIFDRFIFAREDKNRFVIMTHWRRTSEYLMRIKRICDDHSIQFLLVTYPYGHQVGAHQWEKGRQYWAFESNKVYDSSRTFRLIESFSHENQIPFINLLGPLKDHADEKLYYNNDGHWTARGHQVAAQAIFESEEFQKLIRP